MTHALHLAVIVASVRKDRLGPAVARWFTDLVPEHLDARIDLIDLADLTLPDELSGGGDTEIFTERIDRADAVVIVTPEYNRGYPGALKTAIDTALPEWRAKPVGFVSYGGVSGGLRAVEQLRGVFGELHTVTAQASVSFPNIWDQLGPDGEVCRPARADSAAATLLRQLRWWATALRNARELAPYAG